MGKFREFFAPIWNIENRNFEDVPIWQGHKLYIDLARIIVAPVIYISLVTTIDAFFYFVLYGLPGIFILLFGDRSVWKLQAEAVNTKHEKRLFELKKLVQDESTSIAVASTIIVQVAITALSLNNLSLAHWTARGFFVFSLASATMSVYAACSQYRVLGRCVSADDIRQLISPYAHLQGAPTLVGFILGAIFYAGEIHPSETATTSLGIRNVPSISGVITFSAPFGLLVLALNSFLIGFGIWLGFTWTWNLDPNVPQADAKAVFITYVVGLGVSYSVYNFATVSVLQQETLRDWTKSLGARLVSEAMDPAPQDLNKREVLNPDGRVELQKQHRHIGQSLDDQIHWEQGSDLSASPSVKGTQREGQVRPTETSYSNQVYTHHRTPIQHALSVTLRDTAQLRRRLAESEEHLAGLYEQLESADRAGK
ncbi:hypothetical protein GGR57DRAFT_33199 [Xylariaceae sp. FL1272]|nr:hypothetical protein GGR57DRAFT_33199 [Xylariaceae sp. FL1272]